MRVWPELAGPSCTSSTPSTTARSTSRAWATGRFLPPLRTAVPNLPCAAAGPTDSAGHDMEKAVVTGMSAANHLLEERRLPTVPIIPLRPHPLSPGAAEVATRLLPRPAGVGARGYARPTSTAATNR